MLNVANALPSPPEHLLGPWFRILSFDLYQEKLLFSKEACLLPSGLVGFGWTYWPVIPVIFG